MRRRSICVSRVLGILLGLSLVCGSAGDSAAGGKMGLHGLFMEPQNSSAEDFSDAGWGLGLHVMYPIPNLHKLLAATFVFDGINLLTDDITFVNQIGLRIRQSTSQDILRLMVGGEFGPHGRGFIRPHAGLNLGLMIYSINVTLIIPDDFNPERSIRQELASENSARFGYDATLGLDLNFANAINLDGGMRYVKSFGVPQQFDTGGSIEIHPDYFQIYVGLGIGFDFIERISRDEEEGE
ncbi:MAG: outer membrane beta-barrel protein [Candidatus Krumholzibacteriia bacterium]